jgi:uncharacterized protein YoxC
MEEKYTNKDLLIKIQQISEDIQNKKEEVETLLQVIESLEIDYFKMVEQIKKNSTNG